MIAALFQQEKEEDEEFRAQLTHLEESVEDHPEDPSLRFNLVILFLNSYILAAPICL